MYRIATPLAVVFVTAVLTALPASAQPPAATLGEPGSQQPGSGQPRQSVLKEDFDRDPVTGWDFRSQHGFVSAGNSRALATKGAAFWNAAGELTDFTMKFRYGYERGIALVEFRHAERYGIGDRYALLLNSTSAHLIRVQHLPAEVQEKELALAPVPLPPRTWHEAIVQAAGGQINVWIDGKGVISVRDPQPLRSGMCALSAESGVVLYDHVMLIPQGKADQGGLASDPANWGSWSAKSGAGRGENPSAPSDESPSRPTATEEPARAVPQQPERANPAGSHRREAAGEPEFSRVQLPETRRVTDD